MPKKDERQLRNAKAMRSEPTGPEARLWHHLRAKRFDGVKFTQQVLIGPYIVDFAARDRKLTIELDGDSHGTQERYDARRMALIEQEGFRVIRFSNLDVMTNLEGCCKPSAMRLRLPLSQPSPRRGEGFK